MRWTFLLASLALALPSSCAARTPTQRDRAVVAQASAKCEPQAPRALVTRPSAKAKPSHTITSSTLRPVEEKYVEGPCVSDIVRFNIGHAFLSSGDRLVIQDDGNVEWLPPMLTDSQRIAIDRIESLPGYRLLTVEWILGSPNGEFGAAYLGVFKSKSDYLIARFNVLDGRPSKEAEVLIRSRSPIDSIDYLGAPDAPQGRFGFVQRAGTDKAWLFTYEWNHGRLRPLAF